jgi:hypothetical protein
MKHALEFHRDRTFDQLLECQEMIQSALDEGMGTHDFPDIVAGVIEGDHQFWRSKSGRSCMVTTIVIYPRKKVLQVFLAAGDLDEIKGMYDTIIGWAKTYHDIHTFMLTGRKGWAKALAEYGSKVQVTMILEV